MNQIDQMNEQIKKINWKRKMPEISRFYGISIKMLFDDHDPPHFHVIYNEYKAIISIKDLRMLKGDLPPKAFGMVMEWAKQHQQELLQDWVLVKSNNNPKNIEPLQ